MEEKTEQYTFGPEEKDILEKLNKMESSVEGYIQERYQRELIKTKYYSEMVINTDKGPITLKNVFITEEQDPNGKVSYHFRWIKENKNGEKSIEENIVVDEEGKVFSSGGLDEYLKNSKIDMEKLFDVIEDIFELVPLYELGCDISDEAVDTSYNAMKKDISEL
mgnify:CR=1 FL=1